MSVPVEYANSKNRLTNFRDKILADLVGGRVKAGLDAGHSGMQKYSVVVRQLSVVPYLFGEVQRKAVALSLKGLDVGAGKIRNVRADYTLPQVDYPLQPPFNIGRRKLPQVDVFKYTPTTDFDMLEGVEVSKLRSVLLLQVPHGTFEQTPDVENAVAEYYELLPQNKYTGEWNIGDQPMGFEDWKKFKGEVVHCFRWLTKKGGTVMYEYGIWLFINGDIFGDAGYKHSVPACAEIRYIQPEAPKGVYVTAGMRNAVDDYGLFTTVPFQQIDVPVAWTRIGKVGSPISEKEVWNNNWTVTLEVNDSTMGTTSPPPAQYTGKAPWEQLAVSGVPNPYYVVDHWELDFVVYSYAGSILVNFNKDYKVKCVFRHV